MRRGVVHVRVVGIEALVAVPIANLPLVVCTALKIPPLIGVTSAAIFNDPSPVMSRAPTTSRHFPLPAATISNLLR